MRAQEDVRGRMAPSIHARPLTFCDLRALPQDGSGPNIRVGHYETVI